MNEIHDNDFVYVSVVYIEKKYGIPKRTYFSWYEVEYMRSYPDISAKLMYFLSPGAMLLRQFREGELQLLWIDL